MSTLIGIGIFILIVISILLVLIVLMQRAKSDGGMAAMGGGAAEATFGAETGNVLANATRYLAVAFFSLAFLLFLAEKYQKTHAAKPVGTELPSIAAPAVAAPEVPAPAAPVAPEAAK